MEWLQNNWQFLVGDIVIPIITFIIGLFVGKRIEKKKTVSSIKGNNNTVVQDVQVLKDKQKK